jgi:uncharacterized protein (TIGR04206 family)
MWVRSEYAGELAVLSAWVSALLPWSVSVASLGQGADLVVVRFPFFLFQFVLGVGALPGEQPFQPVWVARSFQEGSIAQAYGVWLVGAVALAAAFLFGVAYYAAEDRIEAAPVDPVRVIGALLLLGGVVLSAATYLLFTTFLGGAIPLGVFLLLALGGVLLSVDRQ